MKYYFFFLLFSCFVHSQEFKIHKDTVYIEGKKVAIVKCTSMRFKYELFDLENNLLLKVKAVSCNKCQETNALNFEFSSSKYNGVKVLTVLEESFNRTKELIRCIYLYGLVEKENINVEKLFTFTRLQPIWQSDNRTAIVTELPVHKSFYIDNTDICLKDLKVGSFKKSYFAFDFKNTSLNIVRFTLEDLDGNFVGVYNTILNDVKIQDSDFYLLKDIFRIGKIVLRDGTTFVYEDIKENEVLSVMLEKAIHNNYEFGNQIKERIESNRDDFKAKKFDNEIFLCKYQNEFGLSTFKKVNGFNEEVTFKDDGREVFFKPLRKNKNGYFYLIKGKNDEKFTRINHVLNVEYVAFEVQNSDIFEKYNVFKSFVDWEPESFSFYEKVFENNEYQIVFDGNLYIIKQKNKNKGFRLYTDKSKYVINLSAYLGIRQELINDLNVKSLKSIVQFIESITKK